MKVEVRESNNRFTISLVAENIEDATVLVRLPMNWKRETPFISTHAVKAWHIKGNAQAPAKIKTYIEIRKLKEETECIQRRG